jgi:hypothetical protein
MLRLAMIDDLTNAVPKIHPATREMLPDDPLDLQGVEVPGDPELMLKLLVEEYARMGFGIETVMDFARNPFYQAFYGLCVLFGEAEFYRRVAAVFARVGVTRVRCVEAPAADQLVAITLPAHS